MYAEFADVPINMAAQKDVIGLNLTFVVVAQIVKNLHHFRLIDSFQLKMGFLNKNILNSIPNVIPKITAPNA
ncbi:MAG: hypothetical protein A4E53_02468 [Pelotomaculum sp. PtaB.Bin104]|nr:MAG: hypothetical protein A4E53_02468 [Pelotomaculum sp. PtaB.Bin104]